MLLLRSLQVAVNSFFYNLTTPFRIVTGGIRQLTYQNPLVQMRNSVRWIGSQFYSTITYPFRMIGVMPQKPKVGLGETDIGLWFESLPGRDRRQRRQPVSVQAQFSQIHLVSGDERIVIHIGTVIGRSSSDLSLEPINERPVYLRFTQIDPTAHRGAPVMLSYVSGQNTLKINDKMVSAQLPIRSGDTLYVGGHPYTLEFYAWDKYPIITRVDAGWSTTTGGTREVNEDAVGIYQHKDAYLFAVADGVGGGQDGDKISAFAIQYLLAVFNRNVRYKLAWRDIFPKAFEMMNAEVRLYGRRAPLPVGTTLTALAIKNWEATVAHVGDSRLYHLRDGILRQLTTDHVTQQPVELLTVKANAGETSGMHDVLTRAVGKNDTIQPEITTLALKPDDKFIIVSDGVTRVIEPDEIKAMFHKVRASRVAELLVQTANERGTRDNASAIVVEVMQEAFVEDTWRAQTDGRVYAGYNRAWALKLKRPGEPITRHPERQGSIGCVIVFVVATVLFLVWNGQRQAQANLLPTATPTLTLTPTPRIPQIIIETPFRTPTPSPRIEPTEPTTVPPTQIEERVPTSTLRPSRS